MDRIRQELQFAFRSLVRAPGFAGVAILTLALGMGASIAIFAVLKGVVLDPLPYPDSERLVRLKSSVPRVGDGVEWDVSQGAWWFFRDEARTVDAIGAYSRGAANVQTPAGPERAFIASVRAETLRMLGAHAMQGRLIDDADGRPDATTVAVLSHGFWQRAFGGDPAAVGRTLVINDNPIEIVGVMRRGFELPAERGGAPMATDLWLPLRLDPAGPFSNWHTQFQTIARLRPGVPLADAQAEFAALNRRLPEVLPDVYGSPEGFEEGFRTVVYDLGDYIVGGIARNLWILFGAVGLVLLIAAANVANLFLTRIEAARRELAIRTALGASRFAIARRFLAESLLLAGAAAAVGLLISFWGVEWLVSLAPPTMPRMAEIRPDTGTAIFALGLAVLVASVLAVFPVLRHGRTPGIAVLADGSRGATADRDRQRTRSVLIVTQVALAMTLIVGASLLVQTFRALRAVDAGIDARGVLTMQIAVPFQRYQTTEDVWRFHRQVLERVGALPGVAAAGFTVTLPFTGGFGCTVQGFEDASVYDRLRAADLTTCAGQTPTSPGYFEAMGIPLVRGRYFAAADNDQPERGAVIVSETFADRFWPGEDPIGKGIGPNGLTNQQFYRVVGVVGDVYAGSVDEAPAIAVYYPVVRIPETAGWQANAYALVVRTGLADPLALVAAIRREVQAVDPTIPIANPRPMADIVAASMSRLTFVMVLLGLAAGVAMLLAGIGLYGVVSYVVARRTGEIGVRMALGARPEQVEGLVVLGSLRLSIAGVAIGVLAALGVTRVLEGLLFGVSQTQPGAYAAAALLLASVALLAAWLPARRAARVDPVVALRIDG